MSGRSGVVIIPARGGSNRVPRKNIRPIDGVPATARVIDACLRSDCVERVIVSTDDPEIARVAEAAGAETPFVRPASLADDHTGILPVIRHAIDELSLDESASVGCVYATAVTLDPRDLQRGFDELGRSSESLIVSVTSYGYPIQRALSRDDDGRVHLVDPGLATVRSQDLPERCHDAGQFIWGSAREWLRVDSVFSSAIGVDVPRWRVIDIDTEEDWQRAEVLVRTISSMDISH